MKPEFNGELTGIAQFLSQNLRYPSSAQKDGAQGRVFIRFVGCEDGTLCDYEIIKGVHPAIDQKALRVTKATSGRWKPGVHQGRKIRVRDNMPVTFSL